VINDSATAKNLPELSALIEATLNADLKEAVGDLMQRLKNLFAKTQDTLLLMQALPPLIKAIRYGSTRQLDVAALQKVCDQMIPRICIGLPAACIAIEEEVAQTITENIWETNHLLSLLNEVEYTKQWHWALQQIIDAKQSNVYISGSAVRILFDKSMLTTEATAQRMRYALSEIDNSNDTAMWLEGFLQGSGLLIIYHPEFWQILDEWIDQLDIDKLNDLLPILRRSFSKFSGPERQKMLELAKGHLSKTNKTPEVHTLDENAEKVLPTIQLLLGL